MPSPKLEELDMKCFKLGREIALFAWMPESTISPVQHSKISQSQHYHS